MNNYFDKVFDLMDKYAAVFDDGFYRCNNAISSNRPYKVIDTEKQTVIIHNITGIAKEDINIKTYTKNKVDYLEIRGSTKNELIEDEFNIFSRFVIDGGSTDKIDVEVKNGLLYIYIVKKEPEKSKIKINFEK